jgi:hypothetical protein
VRVVVDIGVAPPTVVLEEPADCGRFHVEVRGTGDAAALDEALRAQTVGALDGDGEALIDVEAVRRLAAGSVSDSWEGDFRAMLDYAGSKGWISDDGASIRAHVERG